MNEIEQLLMEEVYPDLDRALVLKELEPREIENRYYINCPRCGQKKARIYKTGVILYCECGYFSDILSYIKIKYGLTDHQAYDTLAGMIN
jgi:hypothetical protein